MNIIEKISQLNSQQKIYLNLGSTMAFLLILLFFIIVPSIRTINSMGRDIEAQRIDLEEKYIKGQSIKTLNKNLKLITPKAVMLDQAFLLKGREIEFITRLEQLATQNNTKINISLGDIKPTKNKQYDSSTIKLVNTGSANNLSSFLSALEAEPYYINIDSIEFTTGNNNAPREEQFIFGDITLNITANIFWK